MNPEKRNICILTKKDLYNVTRIVRQARVLSDAGHNVTVVATGAPCEEQRKTTPHVKYIILRILPWTGRVRQIICQLINRRKRFENRIATKAGPLLKMALRITYIVNSGIRWILLQGLLCAPLAFFLRWQDEGYLFAYKRLRQLPPSELLIQAIGQFGQSSWIREFVKQASLHLSNGKYDFIQVHDNYALFAGRRVSMLCHAKLIYDAVEIFEHRTCRQEVKQGFLFRFLEKIEWFMEEQIIKKHVNEVICIGPSAASWYEHRYGITRPIVVRNCRYYIPASKRDDIRRDCRIKDRERLVVWFGYFYPKQGIDRLVDSAPFLSDHIHIAIVSQVQPSWRVFYSDIINEVRKKGLQGRIHFLKGRDPDDLIRYASGADIGIVPGQKEALNVYYGLQNKFFEMVMARLPVASSRSVDMSDLVNRYRIGMTFNESKPEDIAKTVNRMLEPTRYFSFKDAVSKAAHELCWERESVDYLKIFDNGKRKNRT